MTLNKLLSIPAALALAAFFACGGGGGGSTPAVNATALAYTDPSTGTYRLMRNASSAGGHLILDLIGPTTGTAMGASVTLSVDASKAAWVDVPLGGTTAVLMQNGSQFNLGSGTPILKARAAGGVLQAALAQKAPTAPANLNGTALLQVALDLKSGVAQGQVITLTADGARCQVLPDTASSPASIAVAVGILKAQ